LPSPAFFPASFGLFLSLFLGKNHIFFWLNQDLHGKEIWLNVPFLFTIDVVGLLVLYGLGVAYLYHALWLKLDRSMTHGRIRKRPYNRWDRSISDDIHLKFEV
jgi:biotin transporter BioY